MKTVAFVPSRLNSQRVPYKNIRPLGKIPLVNYSLDVLNKVETIDEIVLFSSEESICSYIKEGIRYKYLKRPQALDGQETKVQDLILGFLSLSDADIIVMCHITSPFIRKDTIIDCVEQVKNNGFLSAFTCFEVNEKCWFRGMPINHAVRNINSKVLSPVIIEHSLYVFKRELFESNRQRISNTPYVKIIDKIEGHDIDTFEDFKIAQLMLDLGLINNL